MESTKVYLIINEEGKFKIGFTERKTEKRIKELLTGSHSSMQIVSEYYSSNARKIETILHRLLKAKRINREWFELSEEDISTFKQKCELIDYNLKYLEENKI